MTNRKGVIITFIGQKEFKNGRKEINMARKSEFIQFVKGLNKGDIVFINSISLSVTAIDKLREYIKTGVLHPVRKEVEKIITPTKIEEVMNGNIICPQMLYERGNIE